MTKFEKDPFADIQAETRHHRTKHGCGAYTFEDGLALIHLANQQQPNRVLELGTALGYTACCMTSGSSKTHVDTIEGDLEHVKLAREQIEQHGLSSRITVHPGNFDTILPQLQPSYDMAFFDGFAPSLDTIWHMRQLLASGGLLVCANLQLAGGKEAQHLTAELSNSSHWQQKASIEGGGTAVLIKQA